NTFVPDTQKMNAFRRDVLQRAGTEASMWSIVMHINVFANRCLIEEMTQSAFAFRHRSFMEYFAAVYLACYAKKKDREFVQQFIYLPDVKDTLDWYWVWRFLCEMPEDGL